MLTGITWPLNRPYKSLNNFHVDTRLTSVFPTVDFELGLHTWVGPY